MRMRKKKHCDERIEACAALLTDKPAEFAGERKLELEIGCGKGGFIIETAKSRPDTAFAAIEKISNVVVIALESAERAGVENLRFINCDAVRLAEYFPPESVDVIYLNFNDPWPKKGYFKRRLTYRGFLDIYKAILKPGGKIRQKTDNRDYFDFSLDEYRQSGFRIDICTYDLHNSKYNAANIRTEYESIFAEKWIPINYAEVTFIGS